MPPLSKRRREILEIIKKEGSASNKEILEHIAEGSHATIARALAFLEKEKFIQRRGKGRGVRYEEYIASPALRFVDPEEYFKKEPDKRSLSYERFNQALISTLSPLFTEEEQHELRQHTVIYRDHVTNLPPEIFKKELERLTIELSWKSSRIEGNTYSLLDTEFLLKEEREAPGHSREEAVMILNHKRALDYVYQKRNDFKILHRRDIEAIHELIVKDLSIARGMRRHPVGIVGTRYRPPDNTFQLQEALAEAISHINTLCDPFSKTLGAIALVSAIQPFADGNKRTARLLGNALLFAYDACPLSFRSIDEVDYKKALILFYEQGSVRFLKELFIEQYTFAVKNYFVAGSL